jgi:hypothetical protein
VFRCVHAATEFFDYTLGGVKKGLQLYEEAVEKRDFLKFIKLLMNFLYSAETVLFLLFLSFCSLHMQTIFLMYVYA